MLSSTDVEPLKSVLDSVYPSESQQLKEPEKNQRVFESSSPFCRKHQEPACGSLHATQESANFETELDSSIVSEACSEATFNTEVSNYLSVDLHRGTKEHPLSIQKSLDLFFTLEQIEHNCGKCQNKNSVLRYTLRRLPRVLILHLKRYHFTANRLLVKSQQPVEISKYLDISSHCNENTKPPFPLASQASHETYDVPNVSEEMMPDILSQSIPAKRVASDFINFTVPQIW
ncbi:Ubiquitin carboxyl-terminal hydrolase 29 [Microtus ochrogaster]|uniref:Ubiquitin carboxyl-terminal hydrolase 29 n=1 Tax=Microtus ochrogaster TaxID=79684 RepID=A0A8J6GDS9_MICOH|nr:Ubiquitin carboxyl-terminal hydrolase 29 [Microtus ochrogaster]